MSRTTADLVEACLPQGARLLDLGAHQLKDIPAPERLLQVSVTGLPEQFPPPKTMGTATSLPKPATLLHTSLELKDTGLERPSRQRTLRETIAWSHDLLNPDQQVFFRRLAVFSGGADLDAVAAVAAADLGEAEVLGLVADLVDASLIRITEGNDAEPRVDILGTIRAYALDLLTENGELDAIQDRHAQHYLGVAEVTGPMLTDDRFLVARSRFEAEDANFREALEWALPANKVPSAVALTSDSASVPPSATTGVCTRISPPTLPSGSTVPSSVLTLVTAPKGRNACDTERRSCCTPAIQTRPIC